MCTQHGSEEVCEQLLQGRVINGERLQHKVSWGWSLKGYGRYKKSTVVDTRDVRLVRKVESEEA
jgi:hypothetical protein